MIPIKVIQFSKNNSQKDKSDKKNLIKKFAKNYKRNMAKEEKIPVKLDFFPTLVQSIVP